MNQNVEEIRGRCKTKTESEARKEVCLASIEEVGERAWRKEGNAKIRSSTTKRTEKRRTRDDASFVPRSVQTLHQGKGEREEDGLNATEEVRQVPDFHLDHMFLGDEKEGTVVGVFGGQGRATRAVLCTVVPLRTYREVRRTSHR